jgi:hypothetical protein
MKEKTLFPIMEIMNKIKTLKNNNFLIKILWLKKYLLNMLMESKKISKELS